MDSLGGTVVVGTFPLFVSKYSSFVNVLRGLNDELSGGKSLSTSTSVEVFGRVGALGVRFSGSFDTT